MNVKIFSGLPSEDLETEINDWLQTETPTVSFVTQSQCFVDYEPDKQYDNQINVTIMVWYT